MKRNVKLAAAAVLTLSLGASFAAQAGFRPTAAQMESCFKAHAALMEKPAVQNLEACWRAHGHLMA